MNVVELYKKLFWKNRAVVGYKAFDSHVIYDRDKIYYHMERLNLIGPTFLCIHVEDFDTKKQLDSVAAYVNTKLGGIPHIMQMIISSSMFNGYHWDSCVLMFRKDHIRLQFIEIHEDIGNRYTNVIVAPVSNGTISIR